MIKVIRRLEIITLGVSVALGVSAAASSIVWPFAALEPQRMPVIGVLLERWEPELTHFSRAVRLGLDEQGFVVGRNVSVLYRYAENHYDRLPKLAADLVNRGVDIIFAPGTVNGALAALSASKTVPIVFAIGADAVEAGLVASLNRPGGNATGVTTVETDLIRKRFQLLHEIAPGAVSIGYLTNPASPWNETNTGVALTAARALGVRLMIANASTPSEIEPAIALLVRQGIGAFLTLSDVLFFQAHNQIVASAAKYRLPTIYFNRESVETGGLISYGASMADAGHLAGTYIGRILKGENPAELPVQRPTRIEMALNLKTANALGIEIPPRVGILADQVIE